MSDISQIGVPTVRLTRDEIAYLLEELDHTDKFERDSQRDEPKYRWPIKAGPLREKIVTALAGGWNVLICGDDYAPPPYPKPKKKRGRPPKGKP